MKRMLICICAISLVVIAVPALAADIAKNSFDRGDFISVQQGDRVVVFYVDNNLNPQISELRRWPWELQPIPMAWIQLKKNIRAVYKHGAPEWCEKAREYLK